MTASTLINAFVILIISASRIAGALVVVPFFGEQLVTGLVRNVVTIALAIIVVPLTFAQIPLETALSAPTVLLILVKELIIGLVIGVLMSIIFFAAEGAGSFIDTQRGSSVGQAIDPMSGEMSTTLGSLLLRVLVTLFFAGGGFIAFLTVLYESFNVWPIFSVWPKIDSNLFPHFVLNTMDSLMQVIVLIAAPISILMFLVEFGLGLMNRFAPQLNVFSLSMPIKSGIAFFILILYMVSLFKLFESQIWQNFKNTKIFFQAFS